VHHWDRGCTSYNRMSDGLEKMTSDREQASSEFRLLEWINVILSHSVLIVFLTVVSGLAAYGLCKSARRLYTAQATLIANREIETRSFSRIIVPEIGQSPEDLFNVFATSFLAGYYVELLRSDAILRPLVGRRWGNNGLTLAEMFELEDTPGATVEQQALAALRRSIIRLQQDKLTGMVTVQCTTPDPDASADIANALVEGLKGLLANQRKKGASQLVSAAADTTSQAKIRLDLASKELEDFWRHNRDINTPDLKLREQQLQLAVDTCKETFTKLKAVSNVLVLTEQQQEETINVIQPAERPWRKSWPPTRYAVAGSAFFGFLLALVIAFVRHGIAVLATRDDASYREFARHIRTLNWLLPGLILLLPRNTRRQMAPRSAPYESEALAKEGDGS